MKRKTKIIRAKKKKIKKAIKRERNRAFNKSLKKTLLDSPAPPADPAQSSSALQVPLVPTKYTPPPPPLEEPPKIVPRLKRIPKIISQAPPAIQEKVKKILDEIAPYYQPETIREFRRKHEYVPVEFTITERSRALRGNVKSYEVPIFHSYDASLQLNNTKKTNN